jgi:hypothetical protein
MTTSTISQRPAIPPYQANKQNVALPDLKSSIIKSIALGALRELAISLALVGITCFFVATSEGVALLLTLALITTIVHTVLRSAASYFHYQEHVSKVEGSPESGRVYKALSSFLRTLFPAPLALLDCTTRDVVVHELGHAVAASALFQNASPSITVYPLMGGATSYHDNELTSFGKFIGAKNAERIVSGAGAGAAVLFSTASLLYAKNHCEDNSELQMYLTATATHSIVQHVIYALSAFWAPFNMGHDFISLWVYGIDPITAATAIVAAPVIALYCSENKKEISENSLSKRDMRPILGI